MGLSRPKSAIVYMMGGNLKQIRDVISTMAADISGVVCDGAKPGCALKIATAVESAIRAANMAMQGSGAGIEDGIVCEDVEDTLENLGLLGSDGMHGANEMILQMMMKNQNLNSSCTK